MKQDITGHTAMDQPPEGGTIYTLAQSGTNNIEKSAIILAGTGSDLSNGKALKGKAKRKMISQKIALGLVDVSNTKHSQSNKSYWNTYYCQSKIYTANGRLYGKYCKNRYCTLCCSIRKADIINRYLPIVKSWPQPYLVTLTVRAVPYQELGKVMRSMTKGLKKIISKYRKRSQRGKGMKLQGIRSLECNFNQLKKTYNPHFHIIVPDSQTAEILIKEWLQCSRKGWTIWKAQNMGRVYKYETALIELIKYGSKIFTEPEAPRNSKTKGQGKIFVAALYNIFTAMKGLRIFERFGFDLPKRKEKTSTDRVVREYDEWAFESKYFDWLNRENGKILSEYRPLPELINLLDNSIDLSLG